jgi:hypothetical protein
VDPSSQVQLSGKSGFIFAGITYEGFSHRTFLPAAVRRQVAKWAVERHVADVFSRRLAQLPLEEQVRAGFEDQSDSEDHLVCTPEFGYVLEHLERSVRLRLLRPQDFIEHATWPLLGAQVHALFPSISQKQLRDWEKRGLVTTQRWGRGRYRGYFRSQLVQILLISELLQSGWGLQAVRDTMGLDPYSPTTHPAHLLAQISTQRSGFSLRP